MCPSTSSVFIVIFNVHLLQLTSVNIISTFLAVSRGGASVV